VEHNPYAAPKSAIEAAPVVLPQDGPAGLGGWLVVVAIGLFATPIRLATFMLQTYPPIFRNGTWERLTTPGPAPYHPLWGTVLLGEIVINSVFIVIALYLLFLFFRKSRRFPKIYIGLLISSVLFILVDAIAVGVVVPGQGILDPGTLGEFARSLIAASIWIPYLIVSKRVKNTFVRMDA